MTDEQKALERWSKYEEDNNYPVRKSCCGRGEIVWVVGNHDPADHCIGYAHRTLMERGYSVLTDDDSNGLFEWHYPCRLRIYNRDAPKDPFPYEATTLLDCYLDALIATDKEQDDG